MISDVATAAKISAIETHRVDMLVNLAWTWSGDDLAEPVDFYIAIDKTPSPTKDALSNGLLTGELKPVDYGLRGQLELTALGRLLLRRFRLRLLTLVRPQ